MLRRDCIGKNPHLTRASHDLCFHSNIDRSWVCFQPCVSHHGEFATTSLNTILIPYQLCSLRHRAPPYPLHQCTVPMRSRLERRREPCLRSHACMQLWKAHVSSIILSQFGHFQNVRPPEAQTGSPLHQVHTSKWSWQYLHSIA